MYIITQKTLHDGIVYYTGFRHLIWTKDRRDALAFLIKSHAEDKAAKLRKSQWYHASNPLSVELQ
jgi:hypothetical protein